MSNFANKSKAKNTKCTSSGVMVYASKLCKKHRFLLNSTVLALTVNVILAVSTIYTHMRFRITTKNNLLGSDMHSQIKLVPLSLEQAQQLLFESAVYIYTNTMERRLHNIQK